MIKKIDISQLKIFRSLKDSYLPGIKIYTQKFSNSRIISKISRIINKHLYRFGIGFAINRYDNSFTIYSAFKDCNLYNDYDDKDIFINFGSGAFFHNKWKNYDYPGISKDYKNLQGIKGKDFFGIDLSDPKLIIPEEDKSVTLIYCSHTLEHLDLKSSKRFLSECYRILKPEGVLRLALPNSKNYFYINKCLELQPNLTELKNSFIRDTAIEILGKTKFFSNEKTLDLYYESCGDPKKFHELCLKNSLNKYDEKDIDSHKTYWDYKEIILIAKQIGFSFSIPLHKGSSVAAPFTNINVFDSTEYHISFYIDVIK